MAEYEQDEARAAGEADEETPRTDPRDEEAEGADEEPQPWAKALPGNDDA